MSQKMFGKRTFADLPQFYRLALDRMDTRVNACHNENQISDNCSTLSPNLWQLTTSVWVFAQTKLSVVSSAVGMSINHCLS